jgi:hypothetical protein
VFVFFVAEAIVLFFSAIGMLQNLGNLRRRKRMLATPTTPIAQASAQGPVAIVGTIVPSEQGLLQSPFGFVQAVWVRVRILEYRGNRKRGSWVLIHQEEDGRPFFIDDQSGQQARVNPKGANVMATLRAASSSGTFNDAEPPIEAFLRSRNLQATGVLGFNQRMKYEEATLQPDQTVYAMAPSTRVPGPPLSDAYRRVPGSMLSLQGYGDREHELILSDKGEAALAAELLSGFRWSAIFFGLAIIAALCTLLYGFVSLFDGWGAAT